MSHGQRIVRTLSLRSLLRPLQHAALLVATAALVGVLVNCGEVSRRQASEVTVRTAKTVEELRSRAEQGDAPAQNDLGFRYSIGLGVPRDYAEAVKWRRMAAEQGNLSAQIALSEAYERGEGVPQNYTEAAKWLRKAAEQGDASTQSRLGSLYYYGLGVPQDYEEALRWYRKVAEQGQQGQVNAQDARQKAEAAARRVLAVAAQEGLGLLYYGG